MVIAAPAAASIFSELIVVVVAARVMLPAVPPLMIRTLALAVLGTAETPKRVMSVYEENAVIRPSAPLVEFIAQSLTPPTVTVAQLPKMPAAVLVLSVLAKLFPKMFRLALAPTVIVFNCSTEVPELRLIVVADPAVNVVDATSSV